MVADAPDEKRQPAFVVKNAKAHKRYLLPRGAHLMVQDGDEVGPGDVLAKIPKESTRTKDITGGLPRVVELFEARKPRETAIISEIDGVVRFGEVAKGQRKIYVTADNGDEKEYSVPRGIHVNVQEGERLRAGDPLMDGPLNPHDILAVLGEKELQAYLVNEIQEVYRLQGVAISDKHIEVIVRQMLRWVRIDEVGDTNFLLEQQVDRFRFREENERVVREGGRPALGRPLLLGITKASLSTDSASSPRPASRRRPAFSPKPASTERSIISVASRRTSSSAGSSRQARASSTTATSSSHRNWKKRQPASSRRFRQRSKPPSANSNSCVRKAKPKRWQPSKIDCPDNSFNQLKRPGASRAFFISTSWMIPPRFLHRRISTRF